MRRDEKENSAAPSSRDAEAVHMMMDGEGWWCIEDYDAMPPFLISLPSDTDLWMFVASSGGLTAGRRDADGSVFPYETVDRLYDSHAYTGPLTLIETSGEGDAAPGRGNAKDGPRIWRPFQQGPGKDPGCVRRLYKSVTGNRLIFEEADGEGALSFRYRWSACDRFGLVRSARLTNTGTGPVSIRLLDGVRNILPAGAPLALYQQLSSLVDAYKRADLDPMTRMGIFSLTSRIIDRAEAAEQLRANVAWCEAPFEFEVLLSGDAPARFERGEPLSSEKVLTGRRMNYFVAAQFEIAPGASIDWHIVLDSERSHVDISNLRARILDDMALEAEIEGDLDMARDSLRQIVAGADGIQKTGSLETSTHHFANVLYNSMRGGIFSSGYTIDSADLTDFIRTRSRRAAERHKALLAGLPGRLTAGAALEAARGMGDPDLVRLVSEYLPLYFGRRHGDPSRPWNRFSIRVKGAGVKRVLYHEGNWRDIFQNWEALALSYPGFLPSMISRFVNASTVDGFNPYRITRDGIDWEVSDPDDPWSYIGYWGDHQIIYLLKLLEALGRYYPGRLEQMLGEEVFSYADVPYRLRSWNDILSNPRDTVVYDTEMAESIEERVALEGTDGKLLHGPGGGVHHVNMLEKLLVPVLSKLSNLVPGGGIWMNTQRPEWNDANNALAGWGLSVVTLCYLRRHLSFLGGLLERLGEKELPISVEVAEWAGRLGEAFESFRPHVESPGPAGDRDRKAMMDSLGEAFEDYRNALYDEGFSGTRPVAVSGLRSLLSGALGIVDHSIRANRRDDGLYHAYNILELSDDRSEARIERLYEMLEGQVAALSSGFVGPEEAVEIIDTLFAGPMYRPGQHSFMLYPERRLPPFMDKNRVPENRVMSIPLLAGLVREGDGSIIERDAADVFRFNADFSNSADLSKALDGLRLKGGERAKRVESDREAVIDLFEDIFDHQSFTGRSGTMYAYEGLGSIYWHMVSKLLLSVQEAALKAARGGGAQDGPTQAGSAPDEVSPDTASRLIDAYYRIRSGLGFEKSAGEYGAFPFDPYSHTPPHGGASQPGMTGQVKEEIIARAGELGIAVEGGLLSFRPLMLRESELLEAPGTFRYYDVEGSEKTIELEAGSLAFTICQVPVVYRRSKGSTRLNVKGKDGAGRVIEGSTLGAEASTAIFERTGKVSLVEVLLGDEELLPY